MLPKQLQDLFLRAFSDSPSNRPDAEEWGKCIHALVKNAGPIPAPKPRPKPQPQPAPKPQPHPTPQPTPKPKPTPRQTPTPLHPTESELGKWNWGAFFLNWIWGLGNGVYWPLALIICNFIPYIGWIASLITCIVLGANGTKWAWEAKDWDSWDSFKDTQHKWAVAVWWILGIAFVIGFIAGL